jgi:deoxyadenosine/deoxycytidine kinase
MFILEGNTGVGKSTFLRLIQELAPEITVIQESVDSWAFQMHGQSLLGNFYQDPKRWAYTMETMTMMIRVREHTYHQRHAKPTSLMERSVYSGHYCFAKNGHIEGFFTNTEWEVYLKWMEFMVLDTCKPPRGFIYLQASPETCFARLRERARVGEEAVTLAYMQQLHDWHEKFMITRDGIDPRIAQIPVLVLDASVDIRSNRALAQQYIAQVKKFMHQLVGHADYQAPMASL